MKIGIQETAQENRSLRYQGEFLSRDGIRWKVRLLQESDAPYSVVGEFHFPAEKPLVIEWKEVDKLEPVQASCATLTVVSKVDRQYIDLYTMEVGSVLLEVYRNGVLYWCGTMDTELYEEPFSYEKEYEVSMTFSDFAMLERVNFSGSGACTLEDLLADCIKNARLSPAYMTGGISCYISTSMPDIPADSNVFRELCLYSDNFYDEEEEPMTQREVLDEVLRPFALRLVQRCGGLYLYDLNAFQTVFEPQLIEWQGTDAVLGVDNVYKNVNVSFSPYERTDLFKKDIDIRSFTQESAGVVRESTYEGYFGPDLSFDFRLYTNNESASGLTLNANARIYKINPLTSGDESLGIAWRVLTDTNEESVCNLQNGLGAGTDLMTFNKQILIPSTCGVPLPSMNYRSNLSLKIKLSLLLDGRYNPFKDAGTYNSKEEYEYWQNNVRALYVPAEIHLLDRDGKIAYSYINVQGASLVGGYWWEGDYDMWGSAGKTGCVISFLNTGDATQGWDGGWKDCCTHNAVMTLGVAGDVYLENIMAATKTGAMYMDLPPDLFGYTLEIKIKSGIYKDAGLGVLGLKNSYSPLSAEDERHARWLLYQMPEIELLDGYKNSIDSKDISYTSWLNRSAREKLELNTVIGCGLRETNDRGLGVLLRSSTLAPVYEFTRQNTTMSLEKLLIGTIYSNYHRRMNVLSGTVKLLSGIGTYTDRSEPGTYVLLSDVQDLIADESDMKIVEVEPDNYEGIEYEETV
nr:MAG TPA: hypothetical protein [Bacteriophage sp.]DAR83197.1 MAG TPA: hypothetical protein [Caudoviricetes sp.]